MSGPLAARLRRRTALAGRPRRRRSSLVAAVSRNGPAEGYSQRWGLIYVDYHSQRRVLKDSARWYRDVIARGGT